MIEHMKRYMTIAFDSTTGEVTARGNLASRKKTLQILRELIARIQWADTPKNRAQKIAEATGVGAKLFTG